MSQLRIGLSEVSITPDKSISLIGQFYERISEYVETPITCTCLVIEKDGMLNPLEIKKTANPGTELTKAFRLLDSSSTPRGIGGIICMKEELSALGGKDLIIPVWLV